MVNRHIRDITALTILLLISGATAFASDGENTGENSMNNINWSQSNKLSGTGSPYLEQHAQNPVNWVPWGDKAFEEARRRDLPLLVSIGYSTCHWCHVMARESFEDDSVAEVMNSAQVNVKVDREQHPGVDAVYMEASQALTGSGGWPLNVFVDHDGRPFLAVTYLPSDRWIDLINQVNLIWSEDRSRIDEIAVAVSERLSERRFPEGTDPAELPVALMEALRNNFDSLNPGFAMGSSPMKFPPSQSIDWLLEHGGDEGRQMALNILTTMMDSGLHDRVGGGFHRYSTEPRWRVPHFEKMAYDNAQLMGLYARAGSLVGPGPLGDDLLSAARSTADWFLSEMRVTPENGEFIGYATATDADDPLGEGSFFAWPPSELEAALGTENAIWLAERWNIFGGGALPSPAEADPANTHGGEFEPVASWIPHPRGAAGYPESYRSQAGSKDREREAAIILELKTVRDKRPAPARDDKVLTDQNSLILEAFSRLARYGGGDRYRQAAVELADILVNRANQAGKYLERTPGVDAYITDYGYLAMGLTAVYSITGNPVYISTAEAVAREAGDRLATGDGAYYSTPVEDQDLFKRAIEEFDGASPAGQHALGIAFARLYAVTGRPEWKEKADGLLESRGAVGAAAANAAATLVRLASIRTEPFTFVVAGPGGHPDTEKLLEEARIGTGPDMMVVAADEAAGNGTSDWVELEGRVGLEKSQLLVCREGSCLLPAFTSGKALERLKQVGQGD